MPDDFADRGDDVDAPRDAAGGGQATPGFPAGINGQEPVTPAPGSAPVVPAGPPAGYGPWGGPPAQPVPPPPVPPAGLGPWHQGPSATQPSSPTPPWPIPASAGAGPAGGVGLAAAPDTAPTPLVAPGPGGPGYPRAPEAAPSGEATAPGPARRAASAWTWLAVAVVAALIGGAVGAIVTWAAGTNGSGTTSTLTIREGKATPGAATISGNVSIPKLVDEVLPAVVSIDVKNDGDEDQGTGMIISPNGEVITNNHVVALAEGGGTITVTESGTTKAQPATLVGADPSKDAALLQIKGASGLPTITFGNSNKLVVGDGAIAIGNALGLAAGTPTVTQGIISALGRTVTAGDETSSATETLTDMIQTDAAINPGNSGGPLIDSSGQVIGMNTAVAGTASDGSSAQNIGFAIPASSIVALLGELQKGGTINSGGGVLGADVTTLTPQLQQQYGFTPSQGAVILSVLPGSPADSAGLQQGDVIVGIDSNPVNSATQLQSVLSKTKPGQTVQVAFYLGSLKQTKPITLESQTEEQQQSQSSSSTSGGSLVPGSGIGGLGGGSSGGGSSGGGLLPIG